MELSNQQSISSFENQLLMSSPPDMTVIYIMNKAFNKMLNKEELNTSVKKYVHRLSHEYENLHAHYSIIQQENQNYK